MMQDGVGGCLVRTESSGSGVQRDFHAIPYSEKEDEGSKERRREKCIPCQAWNSGLEFRLVMLGIQ